jgi:iron complex transport system substrate-binding protein
MKFRHLELAILLLVAAILTGVLTGCSQAAATQPVTPAQTTASKAAATTVPTTRTVTDITGRQVTVPAQVERVACLVGPAYDTVFMLGATSKISVLGMTQNKWAQVLNPAVAQLPTVQNAQNPNIEDLAAKNVQAAFFWNYPDPIKSMTNAGISVIVASTPQSNPTTAQEFISYLKTNAQLYAAVLGPAYQAKADAYCKYIDDTVKRVTSVTSKIPENEKPRVYYVRGPGVLTVHGAFSNTRWWVEMAGGNFVSKEVNTNSYSDVPMEQVIKWNPDVIFMGRDNDTALIVKDPKWSDINAVKNNKVYVNPNGNFYWDFGVEGPLMPLYIAKTLYPDKFTDIDMVKELKIFYSQFFGYSLTDDQAKRILSFQDPQ